LIDLNGRSQYNTTTIYLGVYKMAKQKDLEVNTRGRNVNISNIKTYNTKTLNTRHLAHNTTYAEASKQLDGVSSTPSVRGIRDAIPHLEDQERAALEKEVVQKRKQRDAIKDKASEEFKAKKEEIRKSVQQSLDRDALDTVANSESLFRIEVTLRKDANNGGARCNIDILSEAGGKFRKYVSQMQNRRSRDIYQSVKEEHKGWWGYEEAKSECSIPDNTFIGKIKMRQQSGKTDKGATKMKIAPKVLPKAVCILYSSIQHNTAVFNARIIIDDAEFIVPLDVTDKGTEFFSHKGVWQAEEEML
jgi:hypothetical protein